MKEKILSKRPVTFTRAILLVAVLVGIYYFLPQLKAFSHTFAVLEHSSWLWLFVGLVVAALSFLAAAFTQYAAGNYTGKLSDIVLLQFAGSFVNHFLPFNIGGVNLTTRYYNKHGKSHAQAMVMSTIPVVFGIITTVLMVAIISPITLVDYFNQVHSIHLSGWLLVLTIIALIILVIVGFIYRGKVRIFILEALEGLKSIHGLKQLTSLLIGSLAITLTSTVILFASMKAIHTTAPLVAIFALYVTSSLISNIAPTPGGIGAIEAVLVIGLVAMNLSLSQAAAITITYRFLTFWLPILPGGLALHRVNKYKIAGA